MKTATLNIFFGEMGSGKTYTSNKMLEETKAKGYDVVSISFAQPLKEYARRMGFVKTYDDEAELITVIREAKPVETVIDELLSDVRIPVPIDKVYLQLPINRLKELKRDLDGIIEKTFIIDKTRLNADSKKTINQIVREAMQLIGTEIGREVISEDLWTSMLIARLEKIRVALPNAHIFIDDVRFPNELMSIMDISSKFKQINTSYVMAGIDTRKRRLGLKEYNSIIMNHDSEKSCIKLMNMCSFFSGDRKNVSFGIIQND